MGEDYRKHGSEIHVSRGNHVNRYALARGEAPMPMSLARAKTELMLAQERLRAIQSDVERKAATYQALLESIVESGNAANAGSLTAPVILSAEGTWTLAVNKTNEKQDAQKESSKRLRETMSAASSEHIDQACVHVHKGQLAREGHNEFHAHQNPTERHSSDQSIIDVVERTVGPYSYSEEYDLSLPSLKKPRTAAAAAPLSHYHRGNQQSLDNNQEILKDTEEHLHHGVVDKSTSRTDAAGARRKMPPSSSNDDGIQRASVQQQRALENNRHQSNPQQGVSSLIKARADAVECSKQHMETSKQRAREKECSEVHPNGIAAGDPDAMEQREQAAYPQDGTANSKGSRQSMTEESLEPNVLPSNKKAMLQPTERATSAPALSVTTAGDADVDVMGSGLPEKTLSQPDQGTSKSRLGPSAGAYRNEEQLQKSKDQQKSWQEQVKETGPRSRLPNASGYGLSPEGAATSSPMSGTASVALPLNPSSAMNPPIVNSMGNGVPHPPSGPANKLNLGPHYALHQRFAQQRQQQMRASPLAGVPLNQSTPLSPAEMQHFINLQSRLYGATQGSRSALPVNPHGPSPQMIQQQNGIYGAPSGRFTHAMPTGTPYQTSAGGFSAGAPMDGQMTAQPANGACLPMYQNDQRGNGYNSHAEIPHANFIGSQQRAQYQQGAMPGGPLAGLRNRKLVGAPPDNGANNTMRPQNMSLSYALQQTLRGQNNAMNGPHGTGVMPRGSAVGNITAPGGFHRTNESSPGGLTQGGAVVPSLPNQNATVAGHGLATSASRGHSGMAFSELSFGVPESLQNFPELNSLNFTAEDFDTLFDGLPAFDSLPQLKDDGDAPKATNNQHGEAGGEGRKSGTVPRFMDGNDNTTTRGGRVGR